MTVSVQSVRPNPEPQPAGEDEDGSQSAHGLLECCGEVAGQAGAAGEAGVVGDGGDVAFGGVGERGDGFGGEEPG
jgi:hypothetical protein